MSISVQSTSVNFPLNGYCCYFGTFCDNAKNIFHNTASFPMFESYSTTHQFSSFAVMPCCPDYTRTVNGNKCISADWINEVCSKTSSTFVLEKNSFNARENMSKFENTQKQDSRERCTSDNGSKSKIWRPFSPPPSSQVDNRLESSDHKRNSRTSSKNMFHSIKPSNVKIGHSKTSVFKAVKKNNLTCTQCNSRYLNNRQLNTHMRMHTGSKPFRCEYPNCFKSFARNEELTRHKRIHSGFKPHLCAVCKKRFGRKDHLSKHLKTHLQTSEKKIYQCSFPGCGHRYTRSDALTRHKSTAHALKSRKQK